jgi:hypothetical protein
MDADTTPRDKHDFSSVLYAFEKNRMVRQESIVSLC